MTTETPPVVPTTENPEPGKSPEKTEPGKPPENPETVAFAEFDQQKRRADWAYGAMRAKEQEIEALKAEVDASKKDTGKKKDDGGKLAQAETALAERDAKIAELELEVREAKVKTSVRTASAGQIRDDAFDAFWALEGKKFGTLDSGKVGLVEAPYEADFSNYFRDLKVRSAFLFVDEKTAGTGPPTKSSGPVDNGKKTTVDQLDNMSRSERIKAMAADPALRNEYKVVRGLT